MTSKLFAAAALVAASLSAHAASITAPSATFSGSVITFNEYDGLVTAGTVDLGQGVTLSATANVVLGQDAFDLGDNGLWTGYASSPDRDGHFLSTAFTAGSGVVSFTLAAPARSVGAFVNQFQNVGQTNNSMLVVAYDQQGNVLESFSVSPNTAFDGYDEGLFVGFTRAQGDIYGFGLVNGSFVVDNVTVAAVPEPASTALALVGLGVAGLAARRRRAA